MGREKRHRLPEQIVTTRSLQMHIHAKIPLAAP
jgi:hypothetical protein